MQHRFAHFVLIAGFVLLVLAVSLTVGVGRAAATSTALGFAAKADFATGVNPRSVAVGDFNGDGDRDLVAANSGGTVSVLLGNGSGGFAAKTDYATGAGSRAIAVGDFNGDGNQDVATASFAGATVSVLLGNGSGGFGAKADFTVDAGPRAIAVGDFNGDGNQDLATANQTAGTVSILLGDGGGGFSVKAASPTGAYPFSVATGDFNSDGRLDLATANQGDNTASILLGNGDGSFAAKTDFATGDSPYSIAVGDFNGDGEPDLATANLITATVSVLRGNGDGSFAAKTDFAGGAAPQSIAVGDFNGDGYQDLATGNVGTETASVLLGNGGGGFAARADFATGTDPCSVAVGDFNGDGMADLATANILDDSVSVLLNITLSGATSIEGGSVATAGTLVRIDSPAANVVQMRLRDQGGVWSAWQAYATQVYRILPAGDGTKTIEAQYRNTLDVTSIVSDSILLDTTAPITTDDAPVDWQAASPVTVTLTPDDGAGSGMSGGLAKTQYKLDGAAGWKDGTSLKVDGDGTHTIAYRSIDAVGNVGDIESCTVKIDTTAPITTVRGVTGVWQAWPQTISLTAADAGAGMSGGKARIEYNLDEAGWVTGDWIVVSEGGAHTLQVRAVDAVGNEEEAQRMEVLVDRTAPTTTDNTDGLPHHSFSVVLTPSDALSGVAATSYRIDRGAWRSGTTVALRLAIRHKRGGYSHGVHLIEYRSTDNAGNTETIESCTVTLGG